MPMICEGCTTQKMCKNGCIQSLRLDTDLEFVCKNPDRLNDRVALTHDICGTTCTAATKKANTARQWLEDNPLESFV